MNKDIERVDGDVVEETEHVPSIEELQEELRSLKSTVQDYREEIDHIRADNNVLKEAIVRLQLKSLGLME